jgi:hypothetical protein
VAAKGGEHFRPDVSVGGFVFREPIGFYSEQEADTLHLGGMVTINGRLSIRKGPK